MSNLFNAGCSLIISIACAWLLRSEDYAAIAYAIFFSNVAASVFDFGISTTIVRLYHGEGRDAAVLRAGCMMRVLFAISVAVAALMAPKAFMNVLGFSGDDVVLGRIAIGTSGMTGLWLVGRAMFQAQEDWSSMAISTVIYGGARLVGLLISWSLGLGVIGIYTVSLSVPSLLCGCLVVARRDVSLLRLKWGDIRSQVRDVICYTFSVGIGAAFFQSQILLSSWYAVLYLPTDESAKLLLATSFAGVGGIVVATIRSSLLTVAAKIRCAASLSHYESEALRQVRILVLGASIATAVLLVVASVIYEAKYPGIVGVMVSVMLGVVVPGAIGYFSILIHSANRPQDEAGLHALRLGLSVLLVFAIRPQSALQTTWLHLCVASAFELTQALRARFLLRRLY